MNYLADRQKAQRAQQTVEFLDRLNKLAAASKVLQRDPQTFEQFIAQAAENGPAQTVFIDGNTLMQSGLAEQVAAVSPSVAAQLQAATATGGLVAIPAEEYAARIAPTEAANGLLDHLKTDPNGFTRAEAQEFRAKHAEELQADMERVLAAKQGDEAFRQSFDAVKAQILDDMNTARRFDARKNEADVAVYASYYATRAAQMGVTPEELYTRRRVRFAAEGVAGVGMFEQALASQPPKGWKHSTSGEDAAALWDGRGEHRAVFWTDLNGNLQQDAPALAGYSHSLDKSAVIHVKNRHGDAETEAKHGQLAVTSDDVARIPDLVTRYDDARWEREDNGSRLVAFAMRADDGVLVYLARVSDRRRNMAAVSMWKYLPGVEPSVAIERALKEKAPHKAGPDSKPRSLSDYESDARAGSLGKSMDPGAQEFNQAAFDGPEIGNTPIGDLTEIEVDGVQRPALSSEGRPIHPTQEGIRNFWRWFGDSKVVDAQGRPLVVYHGTTRAGFDAFTTGPRSKVEGAYFFTSNRRMARSYAGRGEAVELLSDEYGDTYSEQDRGIYEVFLNLRSDSEVDFGGASWDGTGGETRYNLLDDNGDITDTVYSQDEADEAVNRGDAVNYEVDDNLWMTTDSEVRQAQRGGEDGTVLHNVVDNGGEWSTDETGDVFVVFSPEQIKSATGNRGTFDGSSPNILYQEDASASQQPTLQQELRRARIAGEQFAADVDAAIARTGQQSHMARLGQTPVVLRAFGLADLPVVVARSELQENKHGIPSGIIKRMPALMADPVAVFKSADPKHPDRFVVATSAMHNGGPVVAIVQPNAPSNMGPVNLVTSFHARGPAAQAKRTIESWLSNPNELLLYVSKRKGPDLEGAIGVQFPKVQPGQGPATTTILADEDVFKFDGGNSLNQPDGSSPAPRGTFNPETLTVSLLNGADLSTALHEGAHFFFENDIALAAELVREAGTTGYDALRPGERQILADVSAFLNWHGIQGDIEEQLAQWHKLGPEERRAHHERTAEAFEAYLHEGKAPSIELAPYFQKFRAWLTSVYKSLKNFLASHPEAGKLNDEVRGVFDRMLATDEQIALAEQARSMLPIFQTAEQAGMTPEEFAAYQALGADATATAIAKIQAFATHVGMNRHQPRGTARSRRIRYTGLLCYTPSASSRILFTSSHVHAHPALLVRR